MRPRKPPDTARPRQGDALADVHAPRALTEVTASVSRRIRSLRSERGFSLRAVAARAQISPSLLSSIERGKASPSLLSLVAIADALGVAPAELLGGRPPPRAISHVVRHGSRRLIDDPRCRREYVVHRDDPCLELVAELFLPPGGSSRPALAAHSGRDYVLVLEGTATIEFAAEKEQLSEGDYIAFEASEPHRLVNESDSELRVLWIIAYHESGDLRVSTAEERPDDT